jgi:YfiH family protein
MTGAASIAIRQVTEERRGDVPLFVHPDWERWSWLVQGTTPRAAGNFASFGAQTADATQTQWRSLRQKLGMTHSVLGRQVHGAHVIKHEGFSPGMLFTDDADGHVTGVVGTLLAVSIADCVPVFMVDERARTVGVLHAGWRGVAAGILVRGIECMASPPDRLHLHFGPAICGACYEVGPDVHVALGLPDPRAKANVDLRAVLAQQALAAGVVEANVTTSTLCTRCGDSPFFSHRAGHPERQVAVIGLTAANG